MLMWMLFDPASPFYWRSLWYLHERRQYHEEREHPEWVDHGGES